MHSIPNTYCSVAFGGYDSRARSICCWANTKNKYNSFTEVSSSNEIKQLRHDLLNGVKNSICKSCWDQEDLGIRSMRIMHTSMVDSDRIKNEIENQKLSNLTIDSGNVCNLQCRTCNPLSSSSHIKEAMFKAIKTGSAPDIPVITETNINQLLQEDFSNINLVNVLGGEPFLNLDHLTILEEIIRVRASSQCVISYTTNGTVVIPERLKKILKEFNEIQVTVSVDAIGPQYEYIRTNGKWDSIVQNVKILKNLKTQGYKINLFGHPTISALNVLYLEELYQWHSDAGLTFDIVFCERPEYYSFSIFTDKQKELLIEHLLLSKFDMRGIVQHLRNARYNPEDAKSFWREMDFNNEFLNLDAQVYLPKLFELLKVK